VGTAEGKRPLGRFRFKGKRTVKMELQEYGAVDWTDLDQNRDKRRTIVNKITTLPVS